MGKTTVYRVYEAIVDYMLKNGYAPSMTDIMEETGLKSKASVFYYLEMLEERGKIRMKRGTTRAIQVVGYQFMKVR